MVRRPLENRSYFDDEAEGVRAWPSVITTDGAIRVWAAERLWRTVGGAWVIQEAPGVTPPYRTITAAEAAAWIKGNDFEMPAELAGELAGKKRPPWRPPASKDGKARDVVPIRLSPAEKERATRLARGAGRHLSDYVRYRLFDAIDVLTPLRARLAATRNIHAVADVVRDVLLTRKMLNAPDNPVIPPDEMLEVLARWAYNDQHKARTIAEAFGFGTAEALARRLLAEAAATHGGA